MQKMPYPEVGYGILVKIMSGQRLRITEAGFLVGGGNVRRRYSSSERISASRSARRRVKRAAAAPLITR